MLRNHRLGVYNEHVCCTRKQEREKEKKNICAHGTWCLQIVRLKRRTDLIPSTLINTVTVTVNTFERKTNNSAMNDIERMRMEYALTHTKKFR